MEFTEYPNLANLDSVLKSEHIYDSDRKALAAYLNAARKSNGTIRIKYQQNYYNGRPYGRFYPQANGMRTAQSQWRHVRSALFKDEETDIDIVNCHPTLLKHICDKNAIRCSNLTQYVTDRDTFLDEHLHVTDDDLDAFNKATTDTLDLKDFKKRIATASLYGCRDYKKNFHLKTNPWGNGPFPRELARITKQIVQLKENAEIVSDLKADKGKPHDGTLLSFILQELELKCVTRAMDMFREANMEITCLIHDGFQIRSKNLNAIDAVLHRISEEMPLVRFISKPFKPSLLEMDLDLPVKQEYDGDFLDVCREFELSFAKVLNRSMFIKLNPDDSVSWFSLADLKVSYEDKYYTDAKGQRAPFLKKWLAYEFKRSYDDVVNLPPGVPMNGKYLNTWKPFAPEKILTWTHHQDGLDFILNHLRILTNHDEACFLYFIKWIGQMIQFPAVKSVCVTLISKQGAGKGSLIDLLRCLLGHGRVFKTSDPSRDVWGMFNGQLEHCYLVHLDELSKKETLDAEGRIKTLVTDSSLTINNKGRAQYVINSYHRFIITTNNDDPIKTSTDDRRNLIIRASDEKTPEQLGKEAHAEYFNRFYSLLENEDVVKTVYEYFKNLPDLERFNSIPIPVTEHQTELRGLSKTPIECFVEYLTENAAEAEVEYRSEDLYKSFCGWSADYTREYKLPTCQAFITKLALLKMPGIENRRTEIARFKVFDFRALREHFGLLPRDVLTDSA